MARRLPIEPNRAQLMRIAFYAPLKSPTHPVPSGDRRVARLFIEALMRAGHAVTLASEIRAYDGDGDGARQATLERELAGEGDRLLADYRRRPDSAPELWFTYHVYHKAPDELGPRVAEALHIPYVIAEASHAPKQAGGPWGAGYRSAAAAIRRAELVLCMTELDMACIADLLGGAERVRRLPPFLDDAPFAEAAKHRHVHRAALARSLDLPADVPWLLAVAMMRPGDKEHSYRLLADALVELADRPWALLVVGSGEREAEVRSLLVRFGDRVRFLGQRDPADLPPIYAAADIYAWPGVNEAFGMAFLEAQAAGLPVVAGRAAGIRDVVDHGSGGLIAAEDNAIAWAAALAELLDNPGGRARMGAAAQQYIGARHGLDATAAQLDAWLAELQR